MPHKSNALCSRPSVHLLLDDTDNDIVCVQETWYTKQDLEQLNSLHPAYHGTGVATIDNIDCLYHGHPQGSPLATRYPYIVNLAILIRTRCFDGFGFP